MGADIEVTSATLPTVNSTNTSTPYFGRNEDLAKVEVAVQGCILFLAILGNTIVLLVLLTRRKRLSRMNLMIAHLSVADLFVAFFNVLPQMAWDITYRFVGGDFLCRSVKYLQVVAMYASSYVLLMTAVDRYLAVCHPLVVHTWTRSRLHLLVLLAWVMSLALSIPQLIIFSYKEISPGSEVYDCWASFWPEWTMVVYVTWFSLAIYVLPFFTLIATYGRICYVVWRSMRARELAGSMNSGCGSSGREGNSNDLTVGGNTFASCSSSPEVNRGRYEHLSMTCRSRSSSAQRDCCDDITVRNNNAKSTYPEASNKAGPGNKRGTGSKSGAKCNTNPGGGYGTTTNGTCQPRVHARGVTRAKVRTVKLTLAVIVCYLFCWGPFFVAQLWSAWDPHAPFTSSAMTICILLASLNSCCNPWIYLIFTDNLCLELNRFIRRPANKNTFTAVPVSTQASSRLPSNTTAK